MPNPMKAYTTLFNSITDATNELSLLYGNPEIPVSVLRRIGMLSEALKQAQTIAEVYYLGR